MEKTDKEIKRAVLLIAVLFLFFGDFGSVLANPDSKVFEVDNVLLKLMVNQGESVSKTIKITNTDSVQRDFKVAWNMNFFSIGEQEFSLAAGENKSLEINFEAENRPGVYVGSITISSGKEELKIPVILEVVTLGDREEDLKLVCPCNFKVQKTWREKGECWCSLFVKIR